MDEPREGIVLSLVNYLPEASNLRALHYKWSESGICRAPSPLLQASSNLCVWCYIRQSCEFGAPVAAGEGGERVGRTSLLEPQGQTFWGSWCPGGAGACSAVMGSPMCAYVCACVCTPTYALSLTVFLIPFSGSLTLCYSTSVSQFVSVYVSSCGSLTLSVCQGLGLCLSLSLSPCQLLVCPDLSFSVHFCFSVGYAINHSESLPVCQSPLPPAPFISSSPCPSGSLHQCLLVSAPAPHDFRHL